MRLFFALSEDKKDLYIFASLECILILSRILVYTNLTSTKTNTSLCIVFKIVVNVIARTSEIFGNKSPLFSNTKTMTFTNVQAAGLEYQLLFCLLDYLSHFTFAICFGLSISLLDLRFLLICKYNQRPLRLLSISF